MKVYRVRELKLDRETLRKEWAAVTSELSVEEAEAYLRVFAQQKGKSAADAQGRLSVVTLAGDPERYPQLSESYVRDELGGLRTADFQGLWDLSLRFLKRRSPTFTAGDPMPSAGIFFNPLIQVLGELSKYTTEPVEIGDSFFERCLEVVGIPANHGWPLKGAKPLGIYRVIGFAFRNQREEYTSKDALCRLAGRNEWALTPEGVMLAKALRDGSCQRKF